MEDFDVSNRGKRWSETDSERLKTLYCKEEWGLVNLAQEFKRTPCSIWSRLIQYNIIAEPEQARGHDLYLDKYAERYATLPAKPPKENGSSYTRCLNELRDDIHCLQKDVQEVKSLLLRVLSLMAATNTIDRKLKIQPPF